jgi:hypothetical protein
MKRDLPSGSYCFHAFWDVKRWVVEGVISVVYFPPCASIQPLTLSLFLCGWSSVEQRTTFLKPFMMRVVRCYTMW